MYSALQGMPGFVKGLTAADIPGANDFMPMDTAEPVSDTTHFTHHSSPSLPLTRSVCVQVLVSDFCEYAGQAVAIVVAGI